MIGVPLLLLLVLPAQEPIKPTFPLGKDTTYVTGPLDKDGYVDYEAALNQRLSKGITPDKNANVLLWLAMGPRPEGVRMHADYFKALGMEEPPANGDYFVGFQDFLKSNLKLAPEAIDAIVDEGMQTARRPWSAKDRPHLSAWLAANDKPLSIAIDATKRTEFFNPLITAERGGPRKGPLMGARLTNVLNCRQLAFALSARAMLRVSEGKFDEAWQDLLACHRLGRLVSRGGTLIEDLVGIAIEAIASQRELVYLQHAPLTAHQIQDRLSDLRRLPPLASAADKVDIAERFSVLQMLQYVRRNGLDVLEEWTRRVGDKKPSPVAQVGRALVSMALAGMDWAPALRIANKWFDRAVAAMRIENRPKREKELALFADDLKALKDKVRESGLTTDSVGNIVTCLFLPRLDNMQMAQDRVEQSRQNLYVAFALAAYRADNSHYPAKLDELAPKYLAAIPADLFSGKSLIYRPNAPGYLLYSVGPNGIDDGGRFYDDSPSGDDIGVRMPLPGLKSGR